MSRIDPTIAASAKALPQDEGPNSELFAELESLRRQNSGLALQALRYRNAFRRSQDMILIVDPASKRILDASDEITRTLGYSRTELQRQPFAILFDDETDWTREEQIESVQAYDAVLGDQKVRHKYGQLLSVDLTLTFVPWGERDAILITLRDARERQRYSKERDELVIQLRDALSKVDTLSGFLPICSHCKSVREDSGYWTQVEEYIRTHSNLDFSHSICPDCLKQNYERADESD